jgi:hypothetical protein
MAPPLENDRLPLDALLERMGDPSFAARYRRRLAFRETSPHVNPVMLAVADGSSFYVRHWRDHARRCAQCGRLFEYFNLEY